MTWFADSIVFFWIARYKRRASRVEQTPTILVNVGTPYISAPANTNFISDVRLRASKAITDLIQEKVVVVLLFVIVYERGYDLSLFDVLVIPIDLFN